MSARKNGNLAYYIKTNQSVIHLRQEGNYIVAVLQTNKKEYETVIIDASGQVRLRLPMLVKVTIDNNTALYSDGKHLYQQII